MCDPVAQLTVKDTASITRKKAQIPQQEQLEHPAPVGGSWLKNRYIVNNYILLDPLGTGSYAEVGKMTTYAVGMQSMLFDVRSRLIAKARQVGRWKK